MNPEMLAEKLEQVILKRIADDNIPLPTLPSIASKLAQILKAPDVSLKQAGELIECDPLLATRLLRQATSGSFGPLGKEISLHQLMARLGAKNLRAMLIEASLQKLFVSRDPKIASAIYLLWQHSVAVGMLARDIAALAGSAESESAHLAGLLHDVGKPIMAHILLDAERQVLESRTNNWIDSEAWLATIGRGHRKVGINLAEKWKLPDGIAKSIRDSTEFNQLDRASVSNFVCLANAVAKQAGITDAKVDEDDNNALIMIGRSMLGIPDDAVQRLSSTIKQRVKSLFD
ncbi:MAG: HDOD domain-containing protein [Myxococcales bacterium]